MLRLRMRTRADYTWAGTTGCTFSCLLWILRNRSQALELGVQATIFHFPLSPLMSFNSWLSMKNREIRGGRTDPTEGSKFLQHFRLLTRPSLSPAKHFFEILEPVLWKMYEVGKSMSPLKKEKKTNPQTKLLSGGRWKVWWFWNDPHFPISAACLGEVFQLPSCSRTFHVAEICVLIHVLVRHTASVKRSGSSGKLPLSLSSAPHCRIINRIIAHKKSLARIMLNWPQAA